MSKPNKYNASGMGANPVLNTAQLYNGPPQSNGPQSGKVRLEGEGSRYIGNERAPRVTPFNQHGITGKVEPGSKMPDSANHPS